MGYDSYPGAYNYDCRENIYAQLRKIVQDKKMIQMTENGPIPNFADCFRDGVKWGLFMTWNDLTFSENTMDHIKQIYSQPYVKKLGQADEAK
jgi:mannan endo-1,4-beta-mannosidase